MNAHFMGRDNQTREERLWAKLDELNSSPAKPGEDPADKLLCVREIVRALGYGVLVETSFRCPSTSIED